MSIAVVKESPLDLIQKKASTLSGLYAADQKDNIAKFVDKGFPDKKVENYKYFNVARFIEKEIDFSKTNAASNLSSVPDTITDKLDGVNLYAVNGNVLPTQASLEKGLSVHSILEKQADNIGTLSKDTEDPYLLLNNGLFNDGWYIEVEKGAIITKPIFIQKQGCGWGKCTGQYCGIFLHCR